MHSLLQKIQAGRRPSFHTLYEAFVDCFDLLAYLRSTPQDPEWHAEGDVYIHTEMVLDACYAEIAQHAQHLAPAKQLALILAALFHDIAKPLTTRIRPIDGVTRTVAPHHADKGRSYLAYKLMTLGLPHAVLLDVLALVGHHHDPKLLVLREQPHHAYRKLARVADLELLYHLEVADLKGRLCPDLDEQLELFELFKLFAEEAEVWHDSFDFYGEWQAYIVGELADYAQPTQQAVYARALHEAEAGLIASPHEAVARSFVYRDGYPQVTILCGPSGAGKSMWIDENIGPAHLISLDELRAEVTGKRSDQRKNTQIFFAARAQLKEHLRRREAVIWDATSLQRDRREALIQLGRDYHAFVKVVLFLLPEDELWRRNAQREHPVPKDVLQRQLQRLDLPYGYDADVVEVVDGEGELLHAYGTLVD